MLFMKSISPISPSLEAQTTPAWIEAVCRFIERELQHNTEPSLQSLSEKFALSPSYLQKTFKAALGISPKAYAHALKQQKVKKYISHKQKSTSTLGSTPAITASIYGAGYNSSSRFYEKSRDILGMPAKHYQQGGDKQTIYFSVGDTTLGAVVMARTDKGVCHIALGDSPEALLEELQDKFPKAELVGGDAAFEKLTAALLSYIQEPQSTRPDIALDIQGTAFQQQVWKALLEVPCGTTLTYQELAQRIGKPKAVRAVASAVGANSLAVIVPCHRVVRLDNKPSGYRWGLERKVALLDKEKIK